MGSMVFTVMVALAQRKREVERERRTGSVAGPRAAGKDLGGRRLIVTDTWIGNTVGLIAAGAGHSGGLRPRQVAGRPASAGPGGIDTRTPHRVSAAAEPATELLWARG
ncbi:MAG TPA: hypothetical protein VN520_05850 [Streptomyces sp.]|jgi:hypothetical protein|uniref:hypothetical protein n=1 Tax=Streptomyces sp. TaxID=1931 RepID=UPI002C6EA219|nr:hypothetical protein [Streptomyces sp.]HWU05908.1 hypothetical protein [Streptomyces sp.]